MTSIALSAVIIGAAVLLLLKLRRQKRALLGNAATHTDSLARRREADARAEWIRRTQWALGAAASSNDTRHFYGITILEALARSDLTGPEDKSILDTVWAASYTKMHDDEIRRLIAEYEAFKEFDHERQDEVFATLRREILAARLKVALDGQLGRETSPTVISLGAMKLPPLARPRGRGGSHTKAAGPTSSSE
ncbi:hypothetical protein QWJ39_05110 [Arthrobacter sp. YD4]|uniref:hypothetical protein n=1 Tax=Arthrobacter sp. YD4 TaxID=3058043 RepID=UPI0025B5813E|nr:hypothetical protein [Arthrobacter sp. YD4]MDN3935688.1 hypothetical protein [Arthrobacter sp. YD4]